MKKEKVAIDVFEKALRRFEEGLTFLEGAERNLKEIARDSAIKRFELCFDTGWKALKYTLEDIFKVKCHSPKSCLRKAYEEGLIEYDNFWIEIVDIRNKTEHIYSEELTEEIIHQLPKILIYMKKLLEKIKELYEES